jgi:CheY-like chemotaxis protein/MinD-like ATPase involved in chromosome partitioning or flagellar assembly
MSARILIVDDNPNALKLVGYMLHREGFEIAVAQSGPEALDAAEADPPDLVILDIMMPEMDGYEVCRRLRAMPQTARTPVIMLTAKSRAEDRVMGFQAGADDYVTKPVLPAELVARVRALLARSSLEAEAVPPRARVIGFLGVKGGVGTTTLAVNVALALRKEVGEKRRVILADLQPWGGAVAHHLSLVSRASLATLLERSPSQITHSLVEGCLASHTSDVRVLGMVHDEEGTIPEMTPDHMDAIVEQLERMADYLLLDLGSGLHPATRAALQHCHYVVAALEPDPVALALAQTMLIGLASTEMDIHGGKVGLVLVNRLRSATTYTRSAIERHMKNPLIGVITPAPELFFHAAKTGTPIVTSQPDSLSAGQFRDLARLLVGQA